MQKKKLYLISLSLLTVAFLTLQPFTAKAQGYNGDILNVTMIKYINKSAVLGNFSKAEGSNWIETNKQGTNYFREKSYKRGVLKLIDTTRNRQVEIDFNRKIIYSSKIHKISLMSPDYDILAVIEGKDQPVVTTSKQLNREQAVIPEGITTTKIDNTAISPGLDHNLPVYHAILIAENKYEDPFFHSLPGTISDVKKLYEVLITAYSFDPANVVTLINASKLTIKRTINDVGKKLTDNDNLFIFYAGHGSVKNYDDGTGRKEGFLIPIDAEKGDEVTFINNQDLSTIIKRSNAKHILFTADASFSGAIFRDIPSDAPLPVAQAYRDKSRKLLSGGTIRALSTESDFARTLAIALQDNKAKYITAGELIGSFKKTYVERTHLQLQYAPIQNTEDMGGEFVFIRR